MQAIHPFPARMAPEAVSKWLVDLPENARVLDPMCGSGVVLRQSAELGYNAEGYDMDPLAVLMSRVWTRKGSPSRLTDTAIEIADSAERRRVNHLALPSIKYCQETRAFVEYWFAEPQRSQLARLIVSIQARKDLPRWMTDSLLLSLSRTIVTKHKGASLAWDVSHSRPHKKREKNDYDVITGFVRAAEKLEIILDDTRLTKSARVKRGDCRNLGDVSSGSVDAIVTSPPYLNAIDYLRGHKLSLVWMGFTIPDLRHIRAHSVGTEKSESAKEDSLEAIQFLKGVSDISRLPNRQKSIVLKYANDSQLMLNEMKRVLKSTGKIVLVLADSVMRGVEVKSSAIFEKIAIRNGLSLVSKETREIPQNKRYLPINSKSEALKKRMRYEIIQVFEPIS